ncbi:hypothetical protein DSUL_140041 [Desulfovibrionales bacterium]
MKAQLVSIQLTKTIRRYKDNPKRILAPYNASKASNCDSTSSNILSN